jgi:hypothetical protein
MPDASAIHQVENRGSRFGRRRSKSGADSEQQQIASTTGKMITKAMSSQQALLATGTCWAHLQDSFPHRAFEAKRNPGRILQDGHLVAVGQFLRRHNDLAAEFDDSLRDGGHVVYIDE